jgi:histidinol dehydrogenase
MQNHAGEAMQSVTELISAVRRDKDAALRKFTAEFDACAAARSSDFALRVDDAELKQAWDSLSGELKDALSAAANRIRTFHEALQPADIEVKGSLGERMGMVWRPLNRVGVYAPGGRGAYPSTVLMDVIPAQVAGVKEIALVSPPAHGNDWPHPFVLAAAWLTGIHEVYRVGGAHAIAGLAYGTESIPKVDKIVGPGNLYVALAKKAVMGDVGIDSIAGPTEVFVVADDGANPAFVAADMLAQAEHDVEAGAVCISTSEALLRQVKEELAKQLAVLPRGEIAKAALKRWGALLSAESVEESIAVVNRSAPEHVELLLADASGWLQEVRTAGAVFLGYQTPEPVGDYYAGTNHVLPTHGSARYASGLGVHDFLRRMEYVEYTTEAIRAHSDHIVKLARCESLEGHARSVLVREQILNVTSDK